VTHNPVMQGDGFHELSELLAAEAAREDVTKPRLTKHQAEVLARIVKRHDTMMAMRGFEDGSKLPVFAGRPVPKRLRWRCTLTHAPQPGRRCTLYPYNVGSPGALAHLHEKGYLTLIVDDHTCPLWSLAERWGET